MKAENFIRKFGWDEAKKVVAKESDLVGVCTLNFYEDLKRLVESYELVGSYGGLDKAKKALSDSHFKKLMIRKAMKLKQAIADVELCNEN